MGLETIKMRDIEGKAKNIYESIAVIAKRARHLNNKRLADREEIMDGTDEQEDYVPEFIVPINTERETKVTSVALEEFLSGDVEFKYVEPMPAEEEAPIESASKGDSEEKEG